MRQLCGSRVEFEIYCPECGTTVEHEFETFILETSRIRNLSCTSCGTTWNVDIKTTVLLKGVAYAL
jgi:uncharacterized Zn finger protein